MRKRFPRSAFYQIRPLFWRNNALPRSQKISFEAFSARVHPAPIKLSSWAQTVVTGKLVFSNRQGLVSKNSHLMSFNSIFAEQYLWTCFIDSIQSHKVCTSPSPLHNKRTIILETNWKINRHHIYLGRTSFHYCEGMISTSKKKYIWTSWELFTIEKKHDGETKSEIKEPTVFIKGFNEREGNSPFKE